MELEGVKRAFHFLQLYTLFIPTFVSDRHCGIAKWIREEQPLAGRVSGAAARIKSAHQKAIYVHCSSHVLNLCIASCQQQIVRNMMDQVCVTSDFFNNSAKQLDLLSKTIKEMMPEKNHTHLINVCRTR